MWPSSWMSSGLRSSVQRLHRHELSTVIARREAGGVLRGGAVADEELHALGELLARLVEPRRLVAGAHAGRNVGVEVAAGDEGGVAVDVAVLEGGELGEAAGVLVEHPRHVHELGEADHLRVIAVGHEVLRLEPRAGGLECVEGTQEESCTRRSITVRSAIEAMT
jgi:hypothetical protein